MASLSIPTTSALPSYQLLPSAHSLVIKSLHRLTRPSLLSLALDWLHAGNQEICPPYLLSPDEEEDEQDTYPPASSLFALREIYIELQAKNGTKRDILDRILEGDWRNGITLYQLAMADMQYLYDHPNSQKWSALKVVRLGGEEGEGERGMDSVPRFHPSTFLQNLQQEVLPDVKAHYNLNRHATLPLIILRIFVLESPYNTSLAFSENQKDTSKTFYIAFPDFSPYVYVSLSTASGSAPGDSKSLRRLILDGIPKAFSKPRERYQLKSTNLAAKNLEALVEKRGGGRTNAAGGGWEIYATKKNKQRDNPLNTQLPTPPAEDEEEDELAADTPIPQSRSTGMKRKHEDDVNAVKRRKLLAKGRFGNSAKLNDGKGIERLDIRIEDPFPSTSSFEPDEISTPEPKVKKKKGRRSDINIQLDRNADDAEVEEGWRPDVRLTFSGSHVFAGIRELVEAGIVDGKNMPGWMTGEEGVSVGVVRDGRIKGFKGSRV